MKLLFSLFQQLPNRVIAAMRHFQALVGVTQELQMSESILNKGGESEEVRKFRKIEYGLRVFVEDDLREAVSNVLIPLILLKVLPTVEVNKILDFMV